MTILSALPINPAAILLHDEPSEQPASESIAVVEAPAEEPEPFPTKRQKKSKNVDVATLPPLTTNDPPLWRRHLHWLLVLALLPLVVSLMTRADERTFDERFAESIEKLSPAEQERISFRNVDIESIKYEADQVYVLPTQKLYGAFLRRSSMGHWFMAFLAVAAYMTFFMFLASDGSAKPTHVLAAGLFTATVGIGFLLVVQLLASLTDGRVMGGASIVTLLFWFLKFISFSYSAATDPANGFFLSFLGFTLGVGLCEECVKAIPLFWHRAAEAGRGWRGILIWGMASGAGFGIAEGIMYSSRYYNGITGPGIYLVRFFSCVALHAIWTGSVAILLYHRRDMFTKLENWYDWIFPTIFVVAIPAVLHGLYDTCLKKEQNGFALLVAFSSFGYLAFLFSRLQTGDDEVATKAMLREYQKRKAYLE